jgi:uncharacterized protein YPO0396
LKGLRNDHSEISAEILSLRSRRSNIPDSQIKLRLEMCRALDIAEADMPFAGELLQVHDQEKDWQGAIERVLHNFGLSLLVPDRHYQAVCNWVDRTHLGGRLVYYRVRQTQNKVPGRAPASQSSDSLLRKLAIKPDSDFYDWLEQEISSRFDLVCCASQEQFRREPRAITRAGQIKGGNERHEKNDKYRVDDRSRYILGWTNEAKIEALDKERRALKDKITSFARLEEYSDFSDLDWTQLAVDIARLEEEKRALESASDILAQLAERLEQIIQTLKESNAQLNSLREQRGRSDEKLRSANALLEETAQLINAPGSEIYLAKLDRVEELRQEILGEQQITIESCTNREQDMRSRLQDLIENEDEKLTKVREKIVKAMTEYAKTYPKETQEVDASIEAAGEFRKMLADIQSDDLPRFQAQFKELLNENTIREVANFQSQLARERETIKERIGIINKSLSQIDYNQGRYIVLEAQLTQDADIRDFQSDLRACTEGSFTGSDDEQYSEAKFFQVKQIIERFRGREGLSELDRRWTSRVTDVRNWFVFAASERWRADDIEHEHYSDSGGKSGGQKEKLAYTILAASLAYQFGLEWGAVRSRTFRFVVIDEAFGRGSDESTQYGLKLFEKLGLQILVVTPLQKINVIDPFVSSVGFVHNDDGKSSKLRNLTIEEYNIERDRLLA